MELFLGILIGFAISMIVIKRTINKTGYGQLKMCRETCPYFTKTQSSETVEVKAADGEEDND